MLQIITITSEGLFAVDRIDGSLVSMQALVGGWVEAVDFEVGGVQATLWLNEEGKLEGLPVNAFATALVAHRIMPGDRIVGNVFISGGVDDEGESLGLTNAQVDALLSKMAAIGPEVLA